MPTFEWIADEGLRVELTRDEAELLRELLAEMDRLLNADIPRTDPVRRRLFPDAYEDPKDAQMYREMVGDELMEAKREALRQVKERTGTSGALVTSIPAEEIPAWLSLLTDMRLAIGTRLDVTEEAMESELDPADPDTPAMSVLHWLGWVQGSMLENMDDPTTR